MRRIALISLASLVLGLTPVASFAGAIGPRPMTTANPAIVLAQSGPGWWEQEHQEQPAREGYNRLSRRNHDRYNRLQAEVNQLQRQRADIDQRIARAQREQHELLGMGDKPRR